MKKDEYEIIERSSGYWIVDGIGYVNGPYDTVEEASQDVPQGQLQYPLPFEDSEEEFGTHKLVAIKTRFPQGVDCPECGEITHELFNAKSKSGQEVLLCDACKPTNDKVIKDAWQRGGINE